MRTDKNIFIARAVLGIGAVLFGAILPLALAQDKSGPDMASAAITRNQIKKHLDYLASDKLQGRGTASQGSIQAGDYVAGVLADNGISPFGDTISSTSGVSRTYFQNFSLQPYFAPEGIPALGPNNSLAITAADNKSVSFEIQNDFIPMVFSSPGKIEGPLVFVGYGITAPECRYDDFAGIDVKDKIVVLLRYEPQEGSPRSVFNGAEYTRHAYLQSKINEIQKRGARGMIMFTGPLFHKDEPDILEAFQPANGMPYQTADTSGIPFIQVSYRVADKIFNLVGKSISDIQQSIDRTLKPQSFELSGIKVSFEVDIIHEKVSPSLNARNVVGWMEGSDAEFRNRHIIIGAHYDHIGLNHWACRCGASARNKPLVHNGADDNASGSAALLVLAEAFGKLPVKPKRSVIFVAFDAEELGCLGSKYYSGHPAAPLGNTAVMINLDMVGRAKSSSVYMDTSRNPGLKALLDETRKLLSERSDNKIKLTPAKLVPMFGSAGSDHVNFQKQGVPYMFFYTGSHDDYHRPSDKPDKINTEEMEKLCKLVFYFVDALADL